MQTFLPYPDFKESAKCLDNKRLGKQRVECLQILNMLISEKIRNHPAILQWKGYEKALVEYSFAICNEWIHRGFKDTCKDKIKDLVKNIEYEKDVIYPPWLGLEEFHISHKSRLIQKDMIFYRKIFGEEVPGDLSYYWPSKISK